MRIDVITLFPEVLGPYFAASILGRAQAAGLVEIHTHQLRDYTTDPHQKVDDRPFGGGPGMILMCQPVIDAVRAIEALDPRPALRILLTPQGRLFSQPLARELAARERLLIICGHYEGFDERIIELLSPLELSLGDFVLTGGEPAALAVVDAVVRLVPGVLGNEVAADDESFQNSLLEYPQYTRPRTFEGRTVPDVLLSGHHGQIAAWRQAQAEARTRQRRPDLLAGRVAADRSSAPRASSAAAARTLYVAEGRAGTRLIKLESEALHP
ncbi:MAG: tRNA (guanosine(37)-N1)-methyltransferase TrmD [Phycisphaerales bacterium]|nr:tRNA (guanosine(37)-N1)-methyltransferase TrmD [Phycisphaerales bacterium]